MARTSVRIEGIDELEKKLRRTIDELQAEALNDATEAGAEIVREEAASLAPRSPGAPTRGGVHLADNILTNNTKRRPTHSEWEIGPGQETWHGVVVELYDPAGRPYLRPAFDATHRDVVDEIRDTLRARVLRAVR